MDLSWKLNYAVEESSYFKIHENINPHEIIHEYKWFYSALSQES